MYNDGIISDHRGMFIDFDPAYLFGGSILDPVASASRGFTSKNDKKAKKYLDSLEKYFMDHKVVERVNRLVEEAPDMRASSMGASERARSERAS